MCSFWLSSQTTMSSVVTKTSRDFAQGKSVACVAFFMIDHSNEAPKEMLHWVRTAAWAVHPVTKRTWQNSFVPKSCCKVRLIVLDRLRDVQKHHKQVGWQRPWQASSLQGKRDPSQKGHGAPDMSERLHFMPLFTSAVFETVNPCQCLRSWKEWWWTSSAPSAVPPWTCGRRFQALDDAFGATQVVVVILQFQGVVKERYKTLRHWMWRTMNLSAIASQLQTMVDMPNRCWWIRLQKALIWSLQIQLTVRNWPVANCLLSLVVGRFQNVSEYLKMLFTKLRHPYLTLLPIFPLQRFIAMASITISAPGRHLSLPKSVASVGVDAWNKKARDGHMDIMASKPAHKKAWPVESGKSWLLYPSLKLISQAWTGCQALATWVSAYIWVYW